MTIASTTNRVTYTGNGVTTAFAFAYPFFSTEDIVVVETIIATGVQTTKALTTDYTISGTTDSLGHYSSGGTVNAVSAPASTVTWTIYRDPSAVQSTDFVTNDDLPAESLEAAIDYQTMLVQRTRDLVGRTLRQPEGDSAAIDYLPAKVTRASKYLAFDADGDPVATAGTTSDVVVSTFMETVLDDTTAGAVRTTIGAAASGLTTASGLTIPTARLAGRTTASTGALEDISIGNGLTMAAGSLAADTASETVDGIVELATQAEVNAMSDTARVLTPNHNKIVMGTLAASTSGSSVDFTGIPAGVRRITIMLNGVSLSGGDDILVQIGDSGGLENSGYTGSGSVITNAAAVSAATYSAGFGIPSAAAGNVINGPVTLTLIDAATFTWACSGVLGRSNANGMVMFAGTKSLTATLDRISLVPSGSNTFDAGSVNIAYER